MRLSVTSNNDSDAVSGVAPTATKVMMAPHFTPMQNVGSSVGYAAKPGIQSTVIRHDISSTSTITSLIHMSLPMVEVDDNTIGGSLVVWLYLSNTQPPCYGLSLLAGWEE
jgi:hypothetical protein